MKLGIMQPYFFPYIGYFQLIAHVDRFVVYDNIKYTKKGWINRNRFLSNGKDAIFSLPITHASDSLTIRERNIAPSFNRQKILNQVSNAYSKAPYFETAYAVFKAAVVCSETNLFAYLLHSLTVICDYLDIKTPFIISSTLPIDHSLTSQDKVLAICTQLKAREYINPIGGLDLYQSSTFFDHGIDLKFIRSKEVEYKQFTQPFVPWLSILDVMMFNSVPAIRELLNHYEKIESKN